jgi:hypothetical protein
MPGSRKHIFFMLGTKTPVARIRCGGGRDSKSVSIMLYRCKTQPMLSAASFFFNMTGHVIC